MHLILSDCLFLGVTFRLTMIYLETSDTLHKEASEAIIYFYKKLHLNIQLNTLLNRVYVIDKKNPNFSTLY